MKNSKIQKQNASSFIPTTNIFTINLPNAQENFLDMSDRSTNEYQEEFYPQINLEKSQPLKEDSHFTHKKIDITQYTYLKPSIYSVRTENLNNLDQIPQNQQIK